VSIEFCATIRIGKNGAVRCVGSCRTGRSCQMYSWNVKTPSGTGLIVLGCACART
jgi:hypothetical protein